MMSLKTRVRISIVAPAITAVLILLALNIRGFVETKFRDMLDRAQGVSRQVGGFLMDRLETQAALAKPRPRGLEERKRLWAEIVSTDPAVSSLLNYALTDSSDLIEVFVENDDGVILASSTPGTAGQRSLPRPDVSHWRQQQLWGKLIEVLWFPRNYEVRLPIAVAGQTKALFTVKAVVSQVLLRDALKPELINIGLVSAGALGLSLLLAILVSNLTLASLNTIGQTIDRIARGDFDKALPPGPHESKELAVVHSKLNLLGEQFRGARNDAVQLRSGIEQLLQKLETAVLLFDQNGHLIVAGRAVERLLGLDRRDLVGRTLDEIFPGAAPVSEVLKSAVALGRSVRDYSFRLERDGEPSAPLLLNCEVLENFSSGQRIGTLITLRDAEPRRQIESHLEVATRLAAISRLTGGVAHEIKNPLNAIALHLEVLKSKLAEDDSGRKEIEVISREITRLDRVVKTFLDFNRPVNLQMRELNLADLIRDIRSLVEVEAKSRAVEVVLQTEAEASPIRADRDLLKQAILNVVMNGVEAMRQGGRLVIRVSGAGDEQVLSVSDQGMGIPSEVRDKVFNLYFSTKQKGSGIGLAMTFRVVQLHGGTIDFTSEPGKGTTFWFRFPALERASTAAERAAG